MRTLASLGGYAYATSDAGLWVNLYVQGAVNISISGHKVTLDVTTSYPWDGRVKCVVKPDQPLRTALRLRIPGWCSGATARVNGATVAAPRIERGYLVLDRRWRPGDTVTLALPMPPRRIQADPRVKEDQGQVALARGPLVYCLEGCDNSVALASVSLPPEAVLTTAKTVGLPDGVVALRAEGLAPAYAYWPGGLYRTATPPRRVTLTAIPYYAWDNRAPGAMRVWMPTATPPPGPPPPPERTARASLSFVSANCDPEAMRAGAEPKSSGEPYQTLSHWWPHKGGEEWAQYTWAKPVKASGARVYWFDDTGRGECRVPASWKLLYRAGGEWKPVALTSPTADYPVHPDGWCDVHFAPVTTTAMRLLVEMKPGWAAGARAWKILEAEEEE